VLRHPVDELATLQPPRDRATVHVDEARDRAL
jgi:hypothetical protein